MTSIFLQVVNMSIAASWLVLVVVLLRLLLKKAPKWLNTVLWGIVGIRLVMPFSIESALSLIPSSEPISPEIMYSQSPAIHSGIPVVNNMVNPIISGSFAPSPEASANPLQILIPIAAAVWVIGIVFMFLYAGISYFRLRRRIETAVPLRDNIYQSENVRSPFVLGFLCPRIYLPFQMTDMDMDNVIVHEQTHIKRRDHLIKPFGFMLLSLYWFNPLIWVAYTLLCRDIELACDERVIKELGVEQRADYSQSLLTCSIHRSMISACPLAFGEVGVKERVKHIVNYKKPAFWLIVIAFVSCVIVAVCFLTSPKEQDLSFLNYENLVSVAAQSETLEIQHHLDGIENQVPGKDIGVFLDNAKWKEKKYSSPLELAPDITIYFDEVAELRFYESEPELAMILADGRWRYYRMKNTSYNDIEECIKRSSNGQEWFDTILAHGSNMVEPYLSPVDHKIVFGEQEDTNGTVTRNGTEKPYELTAEEVKFISNILAQGDWDNEGTAECINDCKLIFDGKVYYYHSECGTFNDSENDRNLKLTTAEKGNVNGILEKYITLGSEEVPMAENRVPDISSVASIITVNGNNGEELIFNKIDNNTEFNKLLKLYGKLDFAADSEKNTRVGYQYRMELQDTEGNIIQAVTPYKDGFTIDGTFYKYNGADPLDFSSVNLMNYIDLLFYPDAQTDYPAAIMVEDTVYLLSAEPSPVEVDESVIIGYTKSYTGTFPEKNGETNFNQELNMPYARVEGGIAVLYENEWYLCTPQKRSIP
ncbi:MAG: M56 family metallopeptidase [Eubacteriales bacterium]|nr:M56 family metallopeptidase [Eubacteriales bacterium]